MHRIVVDVDFSAALVHEIRNFGEDVARLCDRDGHAHASIADVDRMTDRLVVAVHSGSHVRRLVKAIEELAEKHHLADRVLVLDEKYTP